MTLLGMLLCNEIPGVFETAVFTLVVPQGTVVFKMLIPVLFPHPVSAPAKCERVEADNLEMVLHIPKFSSPRATIFPVDAVDSKRLYSTISA